MEDSVETARKIIKIANINDIIGYVYYAVSTSEGELNGHQRDNVSPSRYLLFGKSIRRFGSACTVNMCIYVRYIDDRLSLNASCIDDIPNIFE